ncbi:hypothetical protein C8J55DRAFT_234291 [Lentinula edodes]|uniref:Uncharacterized protein n=1 Tax=Lentinula lateritia TaxID=40482 RepID=A0A9W8ZTX4_9AGAR|nr:hypothetical protein C8J55DRAFT_234291 [Lentinula edodes]
MNQPRRIPLAGFRTGVHNCPQVHKGFFARKEVLLFHSSHRASQKASVRIPGGRKTFSRTSNSANSVVRRIPSADRRVYRRRSFIDLHHRASRC